MNKFQWHKSFYDRIIRNEKELYNIRNYIKNNPSKWQTDIENLPATVQNYSNVRNGLEPFLPEETEIENYYNKIISG
jgi:hypothetical protein